MSFFGKSRVDEDLERIRKANLPPEKLAEEERQEAELRKRAGSLNRKDIASIILAIYSIVLPYALIFIGILLVI
ncbi:hypothetical protein LJC63_11775, partial [Ruminococcaceae bacterium OttesenSCG-928-L11]|nr:hypothetical protein [Ruminococcaceae bacterium OttesenSCG-928-L11]